MTWAMHSGFAGGNRESTIFAQNMIGFLYIIPTSFLSIMTKYELPNARFSAQNELFSKTR